MIPFVDTHTHLPNRMDLLDNVPLLYPQQKDVIQICSIDLITEQLLEHPKDSSSFYSIGLHPWNLDRLESTFGLEENSIDLSIGKIKSLLTRPNVVAIGECGLDSIVNKSGMDFQYKVLLEQIYLAAKLSCPVVLHIVKAWDILLALKKDLMNQLKKEAIVLPPLIIHGCRGGKALAKQLLENGFYLSFGMYYNNEALSEAYIRNKMLLETDGCNVKIEECYNQVAGSLRIDLSYLKLNVWQTASFLYPKIAKAILHN